MKFSNLRDKEKRIKFRAPRATREGFHIFIRFDIIPACDRHVVTAIAMLCYGYASREQKWSKLFYPLYSNYGR